MGHLDVHVFDGGLVEFGCLDAFRLLLLPEIVKLDFLQGILVGLYVGRGVRV